MAHSDTDPTELTHRDTIQAPTSMTHLDTIPSPSDMTHLDTIPAASFHEAVTPLAFRAAAPTDSPWPSTIWLVLWSDGTVDSFPAAHMADEQLRYWTESHPMTLTDCPIWAVEKREVSL